MKRRQFNQALAAAGALAAASPFSIVRAQAQKLRVGVLLPRSGVQAGIGQDCHRGVQVAASVLRELGLPELDLMNGDTESNVDVARSRAERLISEGAQLLVGAFDSGQTTAIAQVAEQRGIPLVINIAAAPPITEQGYKFVFRNFPTAPMILGDAFANQLEIFSLTGNGAQDRGVHARERHLRRRHAEGLHRRDVEVSADTLQGGGHHRLRPGGARPLGRGGEGQGERRRGARHGEPPERRHPHHARAGEAALEPDGGAQHGARAGTRTST